MAKAFSGLGATICDTSADLPSSPVEGLIVFQRDTNELKIYDGSVWVSVLDTDTPPGLVLLSTNAMGAVTNSVSDVFSSAYTSYRVVVSFANGSAATRGVGLRFKTSSDDTSANYSWYQRGIYASGTLFDAGAVGQTGTTVCSIGTTTLGQSLVFDVMSPNQASAITAYTGQALTYQSDVTSYVFRLLGGAMNTTTQYTGFSIYGVTDVLNGTIRTYGYRNSI